MMTVVKEAQVDLDGLPPGGRRPRSPEQMTDQLRIVEEVDHVSSHVLLRDDLPRDFADTHGDVVGLWLVMACDQAVYR